MNKDRLSALEGLVFGHRIPVLVLFLLLTLGMAWSATGLRIDAGFSKLLPLEHEYMQTFVEYRAEYGGANRVLVALTVDEGDIFTPEFFEVLRRATDEVFFIPGIDRTRVSSLFTPNVLFTEVQEDGFSGGPVIPGDFDNSPQALERVRENVLKSGFVGRLVANDLSAAIISAQLLEQDPNSGKKLDYLLVAEQLEERIREKFLAEDHGVPGLNIHIIGFAKIIGDVADGAADVAFFFLIAILISAVLVYLYARSWRLTWIPLLCSMVAVVWQLGMLPLLGYGIDPLSILVPFLVFAIGVSHGVQMISSIGSEIYDGADFEQAARRSFRRLLLPGGIALASDTIGFITILQIDIGIIREMAITASLGVASIILTNLILLPVLAAGLGRADEHRKRLKQRAGHMHPLWDRISIVARRGPAAGVIVVALGLLGFGVWQAGQVRIGDLHEGVPELRPDSRYNQDSRVITERFAIGVDVMSVIVETKAEGCIDYDIMAEVDRFEWSMRNVDGVQSVIGLASIARKVNSGWNEGNIKWKSLPRDPRNLAQVVSYTPTSSGLLNRDCSTMAILVFTEDHRAETIQRVVDAVKDFRDNSPQADLDFRLATGNLGVMAATNEAISAAQYPMLLYVFSAVILLCLITFRSIVAVLCIVLPLALVSLLAYAVMAMLEIGLKVNTLPVVALGVGIGVDYGIYIYSRLQDLLKQGIPLQEAYRQTLSITGNGVLFTAVTLGVGVATWIFAPLQFQADKGILLTFMFLVNMLGALFLLPALAAWLLPEKYRHGHKNR